MLLPRKCLIPCAGFGTRMLPAAKAVPKELLPIVDRPVIQRVVEEAAAAGLQDVLLIVSRDKRAIEDHFDQSPELESRLRAAGRSALLDSVRELAARTKVHSVRQPEQRGLGDAVLQGRHHIGDEPFACLLGDTIFSGEPPAAQLAEAYRALGTSVIGLEEVPADRVSRYGIVGGTYIGNGVYRIATLVEKPDPAHAPSRLAIAARYVLTPAIFDCIDQTRAGTGNEVQLTDALRLLAAREPMHGVVLRGRRHDVGNPADWLATNLLFASRDPTLRAAIMPMLRELVAGPEPAI